MKDGPFKRAYLQIGSATGWAPFEKVWELLKHTLYMHDSRRDSLRDSLFYAEWNLGGTRSQWCAIVVTNFTPTPCTKDKEEATTPTMPPLINFRTPPPSSWAVYALNTSMGDTLCAGARVRLTFVMCRAYLRLWTLTEILSFKIHLSTVSFICCYPESDVLYFYT